MSNTFKTAIGHPPKLALEKVSYVNFYKLAQITKKLIISSRLCFSLTFYVALHPLKIIPYTSQIVGFRHFKEIFFGDINDEVSNDVSNYLLPRVMQ